MKKSGISLIVLVITIIIMIILASAVILSLSNNGIIGNAKEAVAATDLATIKNAKAIIDADIDILKLKGKNPITSGKTYNEYVAEQLANQGIDVSKYYFSETSIVVIPKGFIVSDKVGENTVENGLVIYYGDEKVSTDTDAATTRDQFVWVPVPDMSKFIRYDGYGWIGDDEHGSSIFGMQNDVSSGATIEPALTENDATGEYKEYNAMKESVQKYGGFYIGRYEARRLKSHSSKDNSNRWKASSAKR